MNELNKLQRSQLKIISTIFPHVDECIRTYVKRRRICINNNNSHKYLFAVKRKRLSNIRIKMKNVFEIVVVFFSRTSPKLKACKPMAGGVLFFGMSERTNIIAIKYENGNINK